MCTVRFFGGNEKHTDELHMFDEYAYTLTNDFICYILVLSQPKLLIRDVFN